MEELELVRSDRDRRVYTLADSGSLRLEGLFSRSATAEAGGGTWRGRRPVRVTLADEQTIDPVLLLFAAFVVRGLASDANTTAAAGASTAATS